MRIIHTETRQSFAHFLTSFVPSQTLLTEEPVLLSEEY